MQKFHKSTDHKTWKNLILGTYWILLVWKYMNKISLKNDFVTF